MHQRRPTGMTHDHSSARNSSFQQVRMGRRPRQVAASCDIFRRTGPNRVDQPINVVGVNIWGPVGAAGRDRSGSSARFQRISRRGSHTSGRRTQMLLMSSTDELSSRKPASCSQPREFWNSQNTPNSSTNRRIRSNSVGYL